MKRLTMNFSSMLIAAAALLGACHSDDPTESIDDKTVHIATRVSGQDGADGSATNNSYKPENSTPLFLYYGEMGSAASVKYVYNASGEGSWDIGSDSPLYWDNLQSHEGIYPFFAASPQTPAEHPAVADDQSSIEGYLSSDLLLAYTVAAKRQEKLNINLRHVLAQLKVDMESPVGENQVDLSDVSLRISGARLAYNLAYTGTAPDAVGASAAVPSMANPAIATAVETSEPIDLTPKTINSTGGSATEPAIGAFLAILPPQTASLKLVFTINDKTYTYEGSNAVLRAGKNTAYKLTITKSNVILNGITLQEWDDSAPAKQAGIKVDLTGDAPTPGTGAEEVKGTDMYIWKQASATDAQADRNTGAHLYSKSANGWNSSKPIYVDDTDLDADRFYATIENAVDVTTKLPDLIGAGPVQMGQGQLGFGFTHLMAQLAINVKAGDDFPAGISLNPATVRTPAMQQAYTLTYAGAALQATPDATDPATLKPLKGLETGVEGTDGISGETLYLVVPQTLAAGAQFTVTLGEKTYTGSLAADMALQAGKKNVLTLTLNPTRMTVGAISLEAWAPGSHGEGDTNVDGITSIDTAISGIDEEGTLYLAAISAGGSVADNGLGIYPLELENGAIVSRDLSQAIFWDDLPKGDYPYNALFVPTHFRYGATAAHRQEKDYLTAVSASTPWGTTPDFDTKEYRLKHAMAQLTVNLSSADDSFTAQELASATVQVYSMISAGPAAENNATLSYTQLATEKTVTLLPDPAANGTATKMGLVAPQTLERVLITINGNPYTLKKSLVLKANQISTLDVNVERTPLGFVVNVTGWESKDQAEKGDVSVDE